MDHFYFGAGLGNFQVLGSASYPHNLILNILGDGGMTGFIIFIILLFLILGRWFRPKTIEHISSFSIALFTLFVACLPGHIMMRALCGFSLFFI